MNETIKNARITKKNTAKNNKQFDAVVIANYGDPGLEEDYFADILSRYVICIIESSDRGITKTSWRNKIVLVKRPEHLWINYEGGFLGTPEQQRRIDANLNGNAGKANAYITDTIPKINFPYRMGERIVIKKIDSTENRDIFSSACSSTYFTSDAENYGEWHTQGQNLIDYDENSKKSVKYKTIIPSVEDANIYDIMLYPGQYEAFMISKYGEKYKKLFEGSSDFFNANYVYFPSFKPDPRDPTKIIEQPVENPRFKNIVEYEDVNIGGKTRESITSCIPLVVTSPNSFAAPQVRSVGTINYSPNYIPRSS